LVLRDSRGGWRFVHLPVTTDGELCDGCRKDEDEHQAEEEADHGTKPKGPAINASAAILTRVGGTGGIG
jgi:hypothetical protein